jgi:hypothetical protein
MGMHSRVNWMVWLGFTFTFLVIICGIMTLMLKVAGILPFSNTFLVLFLLLCGALSTTSFA